MQSVLTDRELLEKLADEVETNLRRHIAAADGWQPHDYVPWDDGRNFGFLGGTDWEPGQSELGEVAKLALTVSVLIADNLPSYHREIGKYLRTGPWWRWVGRWTAEENRHEIMIRNYLMVTRAVDPVELERMRMAHMTTGFRRPALHLLDVLATCAFEEAAAAIRHRNTAALGENPIVTTIGERLAADDELQLEFFANLVAAGLDLAPDQGVRAIADRIADFRVPDVALTDGRNSTDVLAAAGIYDPEREGELVFAPLLERWNIFSRTDFGEDGELARAELARYRR
ncbi:acyl-ACP desaturase [Nocardia pseudobrasiliensis]|uniref:Acyl-[acyl-carrier-protein] desaturase n=1 Tax=Nocardia pseudobrasiliensis TaxID=45979 RepID=A0A370HQA1_9NOCA|nr:acyl-ACP desaturase [Nocardia pseudobrasiliensis]RDI59074.1 acyl-[acyl-carrier-protein] desaturase [Nocardia pseudobrasiliensis]